MRERGVEGRTDRENKEGREKREGGHEEARNSQSAVKARWARILSRTEWSSSSNISFKWGFFVADCEMQAPCQNHGAVISPLLVIAQKFFRTQDTRLGFSSKWRWTSLKGKCSSLEDY